MLLIYAGMAAAVVLFVVTCMVMLSVLSTRKGIALRPVDARDHPAPAQAYALHAAWAAQHDFDCVGSYAASLAGTRFFMLAWKHRTRPLYLVLYVVQGKVKYDLMTRLGPRRALTTSATRDAHLMPKPPGHYTQSFNVNSLDQFHRLHEESEKFLVERGGIQREHVPWGFEEDLNRYVILGSQYVMSLPLWPLRAPWWFFVRRRAFHNRSIEQLHRSGRVLLPGDPGFHEFEPARNT
ncbi:MAG: hypothetical protein KBC05_17845 [Candidatus Hydrogenedentes bacterium]|nr:hypothetical protein [Candidatus Hydrogenedentota bacterium]